ncbi:MAG TPA: diguanylate cyclase [Methylophilaceae bacterium]|nr:diguanylate cyclase [Methylophilaceae bacterium]
MQILDKITDQISSVRLPLYAVTLTAIPRYDTPLLLMLHWHGFRRELIVNLPGITSSLHSVPGSALQLNERWQDLESVESAMLDAAWQLGAWNVERDERRGCNYIAASEREALECRQVFGEHPLFDADELHLIAETPDREDLMHMGARVGYIRWQFRPVVGGLWQSIAEDDTLNADGGREPPCPISPQPPRGGKASHTTYRMGFVNRIITL